MTCKRLTFFVMLLTGFLNPYGYKTIIYGFSSYSSNSLFNNFVYELLAIDFHNLIGKVGIIVIVTTIVLHFCKLKDEPLRYKLLLLGTSYLAFDAKKSFYLFLFCSMFPLTMIFSNKKNNVDNEYSKKYYFTHLAITLMICVGLLFLIKKPNDPAIKEFIDYLDENVQEKENIKLFTNYSDGSYAEYRGYNCYLDPRGEIFLKSNNNKEDIILEFDNLNSLTINYKDFIDKYNFDYMLVQDYSILGHLMKDNPYKYEVVKSDEKRTLYKLKT